MEPPGSPLIVQEAGSLASLREDWIRLAELDGDLFKSWEWAAACEDTYGHDGRILLTFGRPEEPLTGIASLSPSGRSSLRVVGFEGQDAADQVGPVCAPADRPAVAAALRDVVGGRSGRYRALVAHGLMREQEWAAALGGVTLQSRPSPVLEFNGLDWSGWLASKSSNFRQQLQRRERKLVREHDLTYRQIVDADELEAALEQFVAFHHARWQGESDFFEAGGRELHAAFAARALERGWLRLWVAELEGRPAAYWLGYRYGADYWFFQLARDPEWHSTSIGMVLLGHTVRSAFEEGAQRYRFLSGRHEYKLRFANSDAGYETVLVSGPVVARLARIGLATGRRVPEQVRDRLRALKGA